jgi:membrane protein DedA with SNARE-associated domain
MFEQPMILIHLCGVLFCMSLVHEDVALLAGALMVVNHALPAAVAVAVLFSGAVMGDFILYSAGAAARRLPWLRRWVIGPNIQRVRDWLEHHFVRLVLVGRFVPGVIFPVYIACGWTAMPLARFASVTVAVDAVYTGAVFAILLGLGESVLRRVGYGAWAAVAVVLLALTVARSRRPMWNLVARASAASPFASVQILLQRQRDRVANWHQGMPAIKALRRKVAAGERIPPWLFYIPVGIWWGLLALRHRSFTLPCAANPNLETGGFWGDSKSLVLRQIGGEHARWVAPFVSFRVSPLDISSRNGDCERVLQMMASNGLEFPVVVKPDIGWQGFGVRLIENPNALRGYLDQYPQNEELIIQRYMAYDGEAGVLYMRMPDEARGRVTSLTLRYFAFVVGDGRSMLRELILQDERAGFKARFHLGAKRLHSGLDPESLARVPDAGEVVRLAFIGSIRVGGLYRDANASITPALSDRFDAIARSMPDFHYGRFDIRFKSLERLQAAEDFAIIEVNGAGAEDIHVWDPEKKLRTVYGALFKATATLFRIGALNRARGFRTCTLWHFLALARRQHKLILWYPPST